MRALVSNALLLLLAAGSAAALARSSAARGSNVAGACRAVARAPHRAAVRAVATDEEEAAPAKAPPRGSALTAASELPDAPELIEWFTNTPLAISKSLARQSAPKPQTPMPAIWDLAWNNLPFLQVRRPARGARAALAGAGRVAGFMISCLFGQCWCVHRRACVEIWQMRRAGASRWRARARARVCARVRAHVLGVCARARGRRRAQGLRSAPVPRGRARPSSRDATSPHVTSRHRGRRRRRRARALAAVDARRRRLIRRHRSHF
jgi:hypothetical protein